MINNSSRKSFENVICFVGKDFNFGISAIKALIKLDIKITGIVGENAQKIFNKIYNNNKDNYFIIDYRRPWEHPNFFNCIEDKSLGINCGSDFIIPEKVLNKLSIINLHPSYLPYNKGCHHSFWSIIDKTPFGASIHWMQKELDSGLIIDQIRFEDDGFMFAHEIQKISNKSCIELLEKNIKNIMKNNYKLSLNYGGSYHSKNQIKEASTIKQDQIINGHQLFDLCRATFNKNNGFL